MTKAAADYSASSLTVLKGLEAVRKRPGMYIGDNGTRGLTHLVYEILDNAVDEALAGHCDLITLELHADGSVSVGDNGRGIPVDIEPGSGVPGVILIMTELHAGGKFDSGSYAVSGGLHGVGASVVNALSRRVDVHVDRGGLVHEVSFRTGEPGSFAADGTFTPSMAVRTVGKVAKTVTGTRVRFWPDRDLFLPEAAIDVPAVVARARQTAFLVPGVRVLLRDLTGPAPVEETFHYDGGVRDFVTFRSVDPALGGMEPVLLVGTGEFVERVPVLEDGKQVMAELTRQVEVNIALRWGTGYDPDVVSFVNIVHTPKGGTHTTGFERALVKACNEQLTAQKVARAKDEPVVKDDVLEGLTAVVVVKLAEPQFIGQTKDELGTPAVTAIVAKVVHEQLTAYLTDRKSKLTARAVLDKVLNASRNRLAARQVKEVNRRKTALENASMPAKLVDCRSEDVERTELFIVEGDSALGTFKLGRDSEFQAALPVRGKILNTQDQPVSRMLANRECAEIIQVLGAGFGRTFDVNNIRYGKLIALADADIDGSHIRVLLLTLCWKYLRPMLEAGRVYAAVPPLHRIEVLAPKKEYIYTYSEDEVASELARLEREGARVKLPTQRYKGLGEMDADQLSETTLIPGKRRLRRLTVGDAAAAAAAFELCMGGDVDSRRDFIMTAGGLLSASQIDA